MRPRRRHKKKKRERPKRDGQEEVNQGSEAEEVNAKVNNEGRP